MPTYRPRWAATLTVPDEAAPRQRVLDTTNRNPNAPKHYTTKAAKTYDFDLQVASGVWTQNDHNRADELELDCDWQSIGLDPRMVRNATVEFHMGNADELGNWAPTTGGWRTGRDKRGTLRFVGNVVEAERSSGEGDPYKITLRAYDYTDLFLRAKPFGTSGIPNMDSDLGDAWRRIVSQTPGANVLRDQLVSIGLEGWPNLKEAVPARLAAGQLPVGTNTDAWAVWQKCMELTGLMSFIQLDRCVVTTTDGYYRNTDPVELMWGRDLYSVKERRNSDAFDSGVGLISFDPVSGRSVDATWPSPKDKRLKNKRGAVEQSSADPNDAIHSRYDWQRVPGPHTPVSLRALARRVYEERSKQEYQGEAVTYEMIGRTQSGKPFDLLDLRVGDGISVVSNQSLLDPLLRMNTTEHRRVYLRRLGYTPEAAALLASAAERLPLLDHHFYLRGTRCAFSCQDDGEFEFTVQYCNRIELTGDAKKSDSLDDKDAKRANAWARHLTGQMDKVDAEIAQQRISKFIPPGALR